MSDFNSPDPETHFEAELRVVVGNGNPSVASTNVESEFTSASFDARSDRCKSPQPDNTSSSEALAKGISTLLASLIRDFDFKAEDASRSQDQLSNSIDRLTRELDQLLEDAPLPFIMQHAARISSVKKRVSSLNSLLKSMQRRLDNIECMLSVASPHEKSNAESSQQL
ncbi:hypothetical protein Nepgr_027519 [Nepenthes gracilis]|uniref:Biogenesis of lysosome-related organelles complex 1 subunit 7 n=1 Tax=Nepenthes gracilis TaxID=150966 RepID=A0AAD3TAN0_NEPGR|nr:hypothetical protein Nepgr_027519 [Nepenthes gracilis]